MLRARQHAARNPYNVNLGGFIIENYGSTWHGRNYDGNTD